MRMLPTGRFPLPLYVQVRESPVRQPPHPVHAVHCPPWGNPKAVLVECWKFGHT